MKHIVTKLFLLLLLTTAGTAKAQQWETIQTGVDEDLYDFGKITIRNKYFKL